MTTPLTPRRKAPGAASLAACLLLLLLGQCSAQWHDTHGAKKMLAALTKEATDDRRAANLLKSAMHPETRDVVTAAKDEYYALYEERGSATYPDGTPIPGNENVGVQPLDPRVPVGHKDPFFAKLQIAENGKISTSTVEDDALAASTAAMETVDNGWTYVLGWGLQHQSGQREDEMQSLLTAAPNKIVRRTCLLCNETHQEIYYKRIGSVPSDIMETLKNNWVSTSNTLGTDFNLYSTYQDALADVNAWTYCDYNGAEQTTGFPGNCGPAGKVEDQWNAYNPRGGQQDVAFFVEDAGADPNDRVLTDVDIIREGLLKAEQDEYISKGGCYGLQILDERRACYRACEWMTHVPDQTSYSYDEGTAKLCRSLMKRGSEEGGVTLAVMREWYGDGTEKGGKIKPTHMLGNDDGLPNMGTY